MLNFKRKRIKLSLIEDYISACMIKNFLNNDFSCLNLNPEHQSILNKLLKKSQDLIVVYEHLFTLLGLDDLSFLILKKELKNKNFQFINQKLNNFNNFFNILRNFEQKTTDLFNNLKIKREILKI